MSGYTIHSSKLLVLIPIILGPEYSLILRRAVLFESYLLVTIFSCSLISVSSCMTSELIVSGVRFACRILQLGLRVLLDNVRVIFL